METKNKSITSPKLFIRIILGCSIVFIILAILSISFSSNLPDIFSNSVLLLLGVLFIIILYGYFLFILFSILLLPIFKKIAAIYRIIKNKDSRKEVAEIGGEIVKTLTNKEIIKELFKELLKSIGWIFIGIIAILIGIIIIVIVGNWLAGLSATTIIIILLVLILLK